MGPLDRKASPAASPTRAKAVGRRPSRHWSRAARKARWPAATNSVSGTSGMTTCILETNRTVVARTAAERNPARGPPARSPRRKATPRRRRPKSAMGTRAAPGLTPRTS